MPQRTEIEATYRVVTPCFCGGVDSRAEFRLPSFKGVLRFWWRALARSRQADVGGVQREEDRLFGSAARGQSRVRMRLASLPRVDPAPASAALRGMPGARYLSYGMLDPERKCLQVPFPVTIQLDYRAPEPTNGRADELERSLIDALVALGLFGGIGAKSRKGFGSLVLTALRVGGSDRWSPPRTMAELADRMIAFARRGDGLLGLPEYTALSNQARYLLVDGSNRPPTRLLDVIALELKEHLGDIDPGSRSLGRRRAGFGLPRHVGAPNGEKKIKPVSFERRASPLFIHINECGGTSVAVLSFLPAQFLPADRDHITTTGGKPFPAQESELYPSVGDFLDRLRRRERRSPGFPSGVLEVTR